MFFVCPVWLCSFVVCMVKPNIFLLFFVDGELALLSLAWIIAVLPAISVHSNLLNKFMQIKLDSVTCG